jgi:hypothetical protein
MGVKDCCWLILLSWCPKTEKSPASLPVAVAKLYGPLNGEGTEMPWYKVVKINPGGKGLLFDGREFSRHLFRNQSRPSESGAGADLHRAAPQGGRERAVEEGTGRKEEEEEK